MKNRVAAIGSLFLSFFALKGSAQYDVTKVDRKAVAIYEKALELADAGQYKQSIVLLQQATARDEAYVDAYLSLAGVYGQLKEYGMSVASYEKAFAKDTAYTVDYWLPYAINLGGTGQFDKALAVTNRILARSKLHPTTQKAAEYRQKCFQFAVD